MPCSLSAQFNCSLCSLGPVDLSDVEKSNPRKIPAKWTEEEECAFVLYLQEQAPAARDRVNFSRKYFNGVAQHLKDKVPNQHGGKKMASTCSTKWTAVHISYLCATLSIDKMPQLKEEYFAVIDLKNTSRFTWSDEHGAGMASHDPIWKDYIKTHKHATCFRNKAFHLFSLMTEMMPSHSKGVHVFHPGGKCSRSAPDIPTNTSTSGTALPMMTPLMPQPEVPCPPISTISQPSSLLQDVGAPPSIPSSFLSSLDHASGSSSIITSISQGKCKSTTMTGSLLVVGSMVSDESWKCVCGPSASLTTQMEHAGGVKNILHSLDEMVRLFAMSGITTNNDIYKDAVTKLNLHKADVSMDDFLDLGGYLTNPKNKHHTIIFIGIDDPLYQKHWLERCLVKVKSGTV
ncbi:hypothetical protein EDD16DRAFT_1713324 [Pisolithus croceorrhizus]|nr:hypothetical protein EDD16DRAFT_1713324 [Pisolithus croceorrhizus]KAI6107559.1 hypothetical protein EV401DRAFT_2077123 [Pisolithus croceorrhizus]KAI6163440.1 hypothetical protein EDD17DRAFT_1756448 [Pisolithus thermaeus]